MGPAMKRIIPLAVIILLCGCTTSYVTGEAIASNKAVEAETNSILVTNILHPLKAGAALADRAAIRPPAVTPAITVTVDATFIRSREDEERHFEVRVGNVETKAGGVRSSAASRKPVRTSILRRLRSAAGRAYRVRTGQAPIRMSRNFQVRFPCRTAAPLVAAGLVR